MTGVALGYYNVQTGYGGTYSDPAYQGGGINASDYYAAGAFMDADGLPSAIAGPADFMAYVDALEAKSSGISPDAIALSIYNASTDYVLLGGGGGDTLTADASDSGTGTLWGRGGDDVLTGGPGADTIAPGSGDDVADGGAGIDTISFLDAATGVSVSLALQGAAQATGVGEQTFNSFENLTGSTQADSLYGDSGANVVDGGGGLDRLYGAAGDDVLISNGDGDHMNGGPGADSFVFTAFIAKTAGVIGGFTEGYDSIDISAIDADTTQAGIQPFSQVAAFDGHAGEYMMVQKTNGRVVFLADTDGDRLADAKIVVEHYHADPSAAAASVDSGHFVI